MVRNGPNRRRGEHEYGNRAVQSNDEGIYVIVSNIFVLKETVFGNSENKRLDNCVSLVMKANDRWNQLDQMNVKSL